MKELVSVVIPTKNSVNTIEMCLKSVKSQTYPNIEIIVVDNHSNDGTIDIAKKYAKVFLKDSERSEARNYGAKNVKGDYLIFIDSDMELSPRVIEECVLEISIDNVSAIIIPEISIGKGFWTTCRILERYCYIGDDTIEAARFFKKIIFQEMKGYDEGMYFAEDWDLSERIRKMGYKISRVKSLILHNEGELSLLKIMKKRYRYAKNMQNYIKKNPDIAKRQIVFIRPAYVRHWKMFLKNPIHALGFIIMRCCEFAASGIGYMDSKLIKNNITRDE